MTIVKLKDGSLAIHSAMQLDGSTMDKLDQLGQVKFIIVPNFFHNSDAPFYAERYPDSKVLVPEKILKSEKKRMRVFGTLESDYPTALQSELKAFNIRGTRLHESVFLHTESKTLIVTDLMFNYKAGDFKGLMKFLVKINGISDGLAYSNLFKFAFLKDKDAARESIRSFLTYEIENVIVGHGQNLIGLGSKALENAYSKVF